MNVSVYQFVDLSSLDLVSLRETLRKKSLGLKGTLLLSSEGFNCNIAGVPETVRSFMRFLAERLSLSAEDFFVKESWSNEQPFTRMLVKLRKEIISMDLPDLNPQEKSSPNLEAIEFKKWLDEKRDMVILDTRNDYEVRVGTFSGASHLNLKHFRKLPETIDALPAETLEEWSSKPMVMFCTGGIRCEKASAHFRKKGFQEVYQLRGGILKYFEDVGSQHFEGDCFVFDHRVALNADLKEAGLAQCYACRSPLSLEEQESSRYIEGVSCPHCSSEAKS